MRLSYKHLGEIGFCTFLCLSLSSASAASRLATLQNGAVKVEFHLDSGTFDVKDLASGRLAIQGAHVEAGDWSSLDTGSVRTFTITAISDELGQGTCLEVQCARPGAPTLLAQFILHGKTNSYVVLKTGLDNTTGSAIRIKKFRPLAHGAVFPGSDWSEVRSLNGDSSCNQVRVERDPFRSSGNDLLLTFKQQGRRRSVVLGALKTADFTKWIFTQPEGGLDARALALDRALPGARLASYLDCGGRDLSLPADGPQTFVRPNLLATLGVALERPVTGPQINIVRGQPFTFTQQAAERPFATVLSDERQIDLEVSGLDPKKRYAMGVSWWDCDGKGRIESVSIQGAGKTNNLIQNKALPAFAAVPTPGAKAGQMPEEWCLELPPAHYLDQGKCRLSFSSETTAGAVVSEVWVWELTGQAELPAFWTHGHSVGKTSLADAKQPQTLAALEANDPLGKLVDAHTIYMPEDSFYLDASTPDPFVATEQYGRRLAAATKANPHIYDFPTVCAWYAGVWKTPGAQNHPEKSSYRINTTPGLVEEMEKVRDCGFGRYSRVAGRVVPDTYEALNPQGWWDDAHWQRDGYYVAPYETSQKFGQGMHEKGGLAFIYFQPTCAWSVSSLSKDFREQHVDWLCGKEATRTLDYTAPGVQEHMRRVTGAMRGGIDGMMVDYCDDLWVTEASKGGFVDPYSTSTAFYRTFFTLLKEGLGTNSWLHERNLILPNNDLTLGIVDSQRTSWDTDKITPDMVSRSGLRWYKNRVVLNYDMDSKELTSSWKVEGFNGSDTDGRRMMLTMAEIAASRLLLANSFRDLSPETLYDVERVFPYYPERRSARPVDAFSNEGWPRVYDFAVNPKWHQVALYNNALPAAEASFSVSLSGEMVDGALGLKKDKQYLVFDFWNHCFVGRIAGSERLVQTLRPGEARMLSVHEVEGHPQFISSNRHLLQGYLEMARYPEWNARRHTLSGAANVVEGETLEIVLASNGRRAVSASAKQGQARIEPFPGNEGLSVLKIESPKNATIEWTVTYE